MVSPLQGPLAKTIGRALSRTLFYDATLIRETPGDPDPEKPWEPAEPVTTQYQCRAVVDNYSDFAIANSLVDAQDRKVLILASTLPVTPTDQDMITIRGETYQVIEVKTDPAQAVWECRCRR